MAAETITVKKKFHGVCGRELGFLFCLMGKTLAGFLRRGLRKSRSYFLQQMLQHSLPLQHAGFDGVAAATVLTKARTPRINKRCFINSSFDFSNRIRPRVVGAPNRRLGEFAARRRNGRTLNPDADTIVGDRCQSGSAQSGEKLIIRILGVADKAGRLGRATR